MATTYNIGDDVVLRAVFKDLAGVETSPTVVVCRVTDHDDVVTTVTASETSAGNYEATFAPTKAGTHWYRFEGSGTIRTAGEASFLVATRRVG